MTKKITLIESRCKGCGFCVEFCPNKVLVRSGKINEKGAQVPEIKYPNKCTGCAFCTMICPDFALIMKEETEKDE